MQQRLQENYALHQLISTFEAQEPSLHMYFGEKELLTIIGYYEEECEYEKALEVVYQALDRHPFNVEFFISQSRILLQMQDYDGVLECVETGLSISPNDFTLQLIAVHAQIADGKTMEARMEVERLLSQTKGEDRVELLIASSLVYEKVKDFKNMYLSLKRALLIHPDSVRAIEKIWIAVELCKNYQDSIEFHQMLIDRNPYNHRAWYNLGHAYACVGDYEQSIMSLEYSFLIDEKFEMGYKDCAEMCFQVGKTRQALQIYLDAQEQFGADLELMVSIGRCYVELNEAENAFPFLQKAVGIDPYDDEAHFFLGQAHFLAAHFDKAIESFSQAILLDDRREEYLAAIAKAYHLTGELTLANYYFNRATEVGPEDVQYWFHHILFLFDIGAFEKVSEVLDEAEIHTYGVEFLYARAALAYSHGDKKAGAELLTEACEEDSDNLSCFYALYPEYENDAEIRSLLSYYSMI